MLHTSRAVSPSALEASMQGPVPNRKDTDGAPAPSRPWAEGLLAVSLLIVMAALRGQANGSGVPSQNGR